MPEGNVLARAVSPAWIAPLAAGLVLLVSRLLPLPHNGHLSGLPPLCVFHYLTGLPCPGCGLTRSFVCMAHGHFLEAAYYHPLGPLFFAAVFLVPFGFAFGVNLPRPSRASRLAVCAVITLYFAVGVARWLGGWPSPP